MPNKQQTAITLVQYLRNYLGQLEPPFPHERHSDDALLAMVTRTFTRVAQPPTYLLEEHERTTTPSSDASDA